MKREIEKLGKKAVSDLANKPISRKEAIKKTGYMAVSAATMMLLLNSPVEAKNRSGHHGSYQHSNSHSNDQKVNQQSQQNSQNSGIWK